MENCTAKVYPTEVERIESASIDSKKWLNDRIKYVRENINDFKHDAKLDNDEPVKCIFCGKRIVHTYNEIEEYENIAIGWSAVLNIKDKEHIKVMYCTDKECSGENKCKESNEAKEYLMWRESDGGFSYHEIIGENGFEGTVYDTKYDDND